MQQLDLFLLTSVSTCFGHHYAHLQENKGPVTAFGVLFWLFRTDRHVEANSRISRFLELA